jgi:hypothetical protein
VNVAEIVNLFRQYTDEPDTTWLTDADVELYMERGYDDFRNRILSLDANTYQARVTITLTNQNVYDLAGGNGEPITLFGATPTNTRMMKLVNVFTQDPNTGTQQIVIEDWKLVNNFRALHSSFRTIFISGTELFLSDTYTGTLTLVYTPESTVDWSQFPAPANEFVDNFSMYHDLIALLAYDHYAIRDNTENAVLLRRRTERLRELEEYMSDRLNESVQYVERTDFSFRRL